MMGALLGALICGAFQFLAATNANAQEKLLLVGDSHSVGSLGSTLVSSLGERYDVSRYAVAAASARTWLNDPICAPSSSCAYRFGYATPNGIGAGALPRGFSGFSSRLAETGASTVVFALGTNDAHLRCPLAGRPSAVQPALDLLRKLRPGQSCIWVGPPAYQSGVIFERCGPKYNQYVNQLKTAVQGAGCRFIDSREIRNPRTNLPIRSDQPDQVHFSSRLGRVWGSAVAARILAGVTPAGRIQSGPAVAPAANDSPTGGGATTAQ